MVSSPFPVVSFCTERFLFRASRAILLGETLRISVSLLIWEVFFINTVLCLIFGVWVLGFFLSLRSVMESELMWFLLSLQSSILNSHLSPILQFPAWQLSEEMLHEDTYMGKYMYFIHPLFCLSMANYCHSENVKCYSYLYYLL